MSKHNDFDQILNSLGGANRPQANKFLLTRIYAGLNNKNEQGFFITIITWLQRPVVAMGFVMAVLLINVCVFAINKSNTVDYSTAVKEQPAAFSLNVSSIYDIENTDQ